ncbi:hypothetical protein BJ986_001663 [Phycicoccus badiiscoriae]|uniref:Uncharacterized protein n=1 Tax=Pedococcus badiiscoriae TaxID=642776 RepID=A0A852WP81_9MICO|nr:hypothetical protein [Pedococcus badiiscoriae]NYG07176.1 hypothetical protein [Pedococcus badiiscoriae]
MEIPAAARAHTPAGAEAFVKFFMVQVNVAWTRPQAGLIPPLGEPGCLSCQSFERTASDLVAKGHRYAKTPATYTRFEALSGAPGGRQYVRVLGTQHRVDIVDSAGRVVSTDAEKPIAVNAMTVWQGDQWLLYDMG